MKLSRRDFNMLSVAALGGLASGCQSTGGGVEAGSAQLLAEPHVCRGLNTCQGKGVAGTNACAGQGTCATVAAHSCKGTNDCAGQGGCGDHPGENACKGQGSCGVPLSAEAWTKARANFERAMTAAGKAVGAAPAG